MTLSGGSASVCLFTEPGLCQLACCAHVGALTSSGSLRCSVPTSSPRRSRFLRSALALLRAHTHTDMHISGKEQSEGRLKCTLHPLNSDSSLQLTPPSPPPTPPHRCHTWPSAYKVTPISGNLIFEVTMAHRFSLPSATESRL